MDSVCGSTKKKIIISSVVVLTVIAVIAVVIATTVGSTAAGVKLLRLQQVNLIFFSQLNLNFKCFK